MKQAAEYRGHAAECHKLALGAKTDSRLPMMGRGSGGDSLAAPHGPPLALLGRGPFFWV